MLGWSAGGPAALTTCGAVGSAEEIIREIVEQGEWILGARVAAFR